MFVVELIYKAALAEIDAAMAAHVVFLKKQYDAGHFLVSGRKVPRDGGVIVAVAGTIGSSSTPSCARIRSAQRGLADFRIVEFRASQRADDIQQRIDTEAQRTIETAADKEKDHARATYANAGCRGLRALRPTGLRRAGRPRRTRAVWWLVAAGRGRRHGRRDLLRGRPSHGSGRRPRQWFAPRTRRPTGRWVRMPTASTCPAARSRPIRSSASS